MCIEDRLDPAKQKGVYFSRIRARGDYVGKLREVPCLKDENHIGAHQIFPLLQTETWYTPTIKHHCPRTAVASSLRACSNKVGFDPKVFAEFQQWFRLVYIPKFMEYMDREELVVDTKKWLEKYPISYRQNVLKSVSPDCQSFEGCVDLMYEAFTKVEMQFTTVPHWDKDTYLNDVKERQICGPCNEKKVYGNAFINLLEGVASKHMKEYCGRANWIEICESIDKLMELGKKHIEGASDGSGFDMTQYPEMNSLMNELLEACARHPNVTWLEGQDLNRFLEVIRGSLILHVSVDHGQLKYDAVGRASGDGWTTFGNTMLMIAYWLFTFNKAGIDDFWLKVKGDDVLFSLYVGDLDRFKNSVAYVFTDSKHEHKHGLGQICKKINYGDITDLDFLSNEFFRTKQGKLRMTRIPARVIQTNSWSTKLPNGATIQQRAELAYSKGLCLKAWADGLPIFGVLADKMIELGRPGKLSDYNEYADGDRKWHQGRDDYDAYCFYLSEKYDLNITEIKQAEASIQALTCLDGVCLLPQLEKLYRPLVGAV